jgi:urease accessory protein UreE
MQLVLTTLDPLALREKSLLALHSTLGLDHALELLERVVLKDPDSDLFHSGRVVAIDFQPSDSVYTFQIGIALTPEMVEAKLSQGRIATSTRP